MAIGFWEGMKGDRIFKIEIFMSKSDRFCREILIGRWVLGWGIGRLDLGRVKAIAFFNIHSVMRSLSSFVAGFKSSVTKRIKVFCTQPHPRIWQRNYYESIVRNQEHLNQIRHYITNNPQKWL